MKRKTLVVCSGGVVAVVTAITVIGAALNSESGLFGAEAAAWAQAGGTIGALLIAVYVAQITIEAEQHRRRLAAADLVNAITDTVDMALNDIDRMRQAVKRASPTEMANAVAAYDPSTAFPLGHLLKLSVERWPSPIVFMRTTAVNEHRAQFVDNALRVAAHLKDGMLAEWNSLRSLEANLDKSEVAFRQSVAGIVLAD
ncbi:hypothetical protein [Caulobacter sp.]|uniref:hypothetical protein n=1 Tax=Caulobacter sp. TaxID=78 RepID=UPI003BAF91B9